MPKIELKNFTKILGYYYFLFLYIRNKLKGYRSYIKNLCIKLRILLKKSKNKNIPLLITIFVPDLNFYDFLQTFHNKQKSKYIYIDISYRREYIFYS